MTAVDIGMPQTGVPERSDPEALVTALRAAVDGEVRFDNGSRATYATDSSNYRQVPLGVIVPRTVDDVVATVAVCRSYGTPVLSRGGGTSLAGQTTNTAVVIDWTKHCTRVVSVDADADMHRLAHPQISGNG